MKIGGKEENVITVIMAAGKGTRMKSEKSKLVHKIYDKELVKRVVELSKAVGSDETIVVVGHLREQVEAVLGDTVTYASFQNIKETLEYDFEQEKSFSYKGLSLEESVKHLCSFTANMWQIHPFCEGNTRTTAVFIIKYLRTFGFDINDEVFADNSWYFRNSLVRANYTNFQKSIFEDTSFLEKFFYNLLTNSNYKLKNRYTHIDNIQSVNENNLKDNNCTLEEQAIINILRVNPTTTQEEIAVQINKSLRTVKTYMAEMQEKGLIERKNGKKNGEWIVNNK